MPGRRGHHQLGPGRLRRTRRPGQSLQGPGGEVGGPVERFVVRCVREGGGAVGRGDGGARRARGPEGPVRRVLLPGQIRGLLLGQLAQRGEPALGQRLSGHQRPVEPRRRAARSATVRRRPRLCGARAGTTGGAPHRPGSAPASSARRRRRGPPAGPGPPASTPRPVPPSTPAGAPRLARRARSAAPVRRRPRTPAGRGCPPRPPSVPEPPRTGPRPAARRSPHSPPCSARCRAGPVGARSRCPTGRSGGESGGGRAAGVRCRRAGRAVRTLMHVCDDSPEGQRTPGQHARRTLR